MWNIILLILILFLLYKYVRRHYTHWQRLGVDEEQAKIPFGVMDTVMKQERSLGMALGDIYARHEGKIVGIYMMNKRSILIRDAQLARQIMTSDFASFHDRGVYVDEDKDPLSANLFNLRGASWRNLRHKLTPSFSSGKIKGMFGTIDDVGDKLVQHLEGVLDQSDEVEIKDVMTTYAVDIIGSVIFGLEIDSFSNPKNEFREISSSTYKDNSLLLKIHNMSMFICPP